MKHGRRFSCDWLLNVGLGVFSNDGDSVAVIAAVERKFLFGLWLLIKNVCFAAGTRSYKSFSASIEATLKLQPIRVVARPF